MLRALSGLGARAPRQPRALLVVPARGRKSRHDPPAKSKAGRVQSPPAVDPAELLVLTERYREYRLTVRALRLEFVAEVRKKVHEARAGVLAERKARENAAEHRELMSWNQAENQRLHELRLARLLQEAREQEQRQAEKKACQAREAQAWAQLKEREVLQLQEEAKNFITRENLDARVEEALDSPKSYNWALTREGLPVRPRTGTSSA
ncbi:small ribosomal subunit protein mS26 [Dasypus novemcinctus]|uniref:small ribosomal subunit protein mS26 n=1 Tax=Dasypus novemcinctus TaxID=9361 RepID=UPI00265E53F4|nr:small ribosomal subunit protein mS26 isoform X2 [Dasypus novemcinctus]